MESARKCIHQYLIERNCSKEEKRLGSESSRGKGRPNGRDTAEKDYREGKTRHSRIRQNHPDKLEGLLGTEDSEMG